MPLILNTPTDPGTAVYTDSTVLVQAELDTILPTTAPAVQITDPGDTGAIPVTASGSVALTTGGAETRTVAAPAFVGQTLSFFFQVDGGDCVITFPPLNVTGNTVATFANVRESLIVMGIHSTSVGALVWRIVHNDGVVLS